MKLRKDYLANEVVGTIYFGGGTPSLLSNIEVSIILESLKLLFTIDPTAEITLEANPDDITEEKLIGWKKAGINRLSIGVQSFFEEDLQWMNRAHTATQAFDNLALAKTYFDNISIDLIYGVPGLTDEKWRINVEKALQLSIPHLSCYALTVEPQTALKKLIETQKKSDVSADDQARQFSLLVEWLEQAGYEHYEISNFAQPGKRSRHNSSYWNGLHYLGLGPSSHSYNTHSRQWNIANNALYISALSKDALTFEVEELTPNQRVNEYLMTALRTMEGIDKNLLQEKHGEEALKHIDHSIRRFIQQKLVADNDNHYVLTREGKLFADGIAADLFLT